MPTTDKPLVARAFEIAPRCANLKVLRSQLKSEGYSNNDLELHLAGRSLRSQLKSLVKGRQLTESGKRGER